MSELVPIVTAAQLGDGQAFGQIVHRFQDMAFACAYAMLGDPGLAQDAAQEAFLDAHQSLTKLREPAAFPGSVDPNLAFLAIFSRDCRDFGVIYSDFGYRKQPISYLKIAQI
ncbi:hypothetical protein KFU94_52880 [Chloroflexi bacterium TSY]|nr:hypothetical protein [Chloroflexi bacterium TSY]